MGPATLAQLVHLFVCFFIPVVAEFPSGQSTTKQLAHAPKEHVDIKGDISLVFTHVAVPSICTAYHCSWPKMCMAAAGDVVRVAGVNSVLESNFEVIRGQHGVDSVNLHQHLESLGGRTLLDVDGAFFSTPTDSVQQYRAMTRGSGCLHVGLLLLRVAVVTSDWCRRT